MVMDKWPIWIILLGLTLAKPQNTVPPANVQDQEVDSTQTRKLLGSSVVTSVSVIMDHGNGTKTYITDGSEHSGETTLGRPPQVVGTPGTLLAPDRYEFYTFGKGGELVKKLMTLDQIQSLIAAGGDDDDDLSDQPVYYNQPLVEPTGDSEGVNKVLESVHNVLKGELEAAAAAGQHSGEVPLLPDQSWTILLPGLLNNDMDLKEPFKPSKRPAATSEVSSTVTTPPTTRFPPRRTTTNIPTSTQHHTAPTFSTNYLKPEQTNPPNRYTTSKIPINQPVASSSMLSLQYSSVKPSTSKPQIASSNPGPSSTVKYSAHYTTPYPTLPSKQSTHYIKPQNAAPHPTKPAAMFMKKPVSTTTTEQEAPSSSSTAPTKFTTETLIKTQASSALNTESPATTKRATTPPPITTYKASTLSPLPTHNGVKNTIINNNYVYRNTTPQYKPTTYKPATQRPQPVKYTEYQRPSGIPTIVHYLPMHSISPSHAPVFITTTTKYSSNNVSHPEKLSTAQQLQQPTTMLTISTTKKPEESSSIADTLEKTGESVVPISYSKNPPSVASVSTKNQYTVVNSAKTPLTIPTTQATIKNETVISGATAAPLVAETQPTTQKYFIEEGNTVSVITLLEQTTKPIEMLTTGGNLQSSSAGSKEEKQELAVTTVSSATTESSPSTVMVQVSTRPPVRQNLTISSNRNRPPSAAAQRTTTATPPRRGTATYTPLPELLYKTTQSTISKFTATQTKPTLRTTTLQQKPLTTTTTTTTTTSTTTTLGTTTNPTETTTTPLETTTYQTKMPLEQIPLTLHENLKETTRPEEASTAESFSTTQQQISTSTATTDSASTETTDYITVSTITTQPNKVLIVNNSEPFMVKQDVSEQKLSSSATTDQESTTTELNQTTTTIFSTTPPTTEGLTTVNSESTTMDPLTTFKDQILEEGINAVTSILLDGEQKKEFLINMTKPLGLFNHTFVKTTTEELEEVNQTTVTELATSTETVPYSEEKSETRLDEIELTEKYDETTDKQSEMLSTTGTDEIWESTDRTETEYHNQIKNDVKDNSENPLTKTKEAVKPNAIKQQPNVSESSSDIPSLSASLMNPSNPPVKQANITESKNPINIKLTAQQTTKEPTQQEVKKQSTSNETKAKPSVNKGKPTQQKKPVQQVNKTEVQKNSTKTETDDNGKLPVKLQMKNQANEELKKASVVPTKESKYNPDMVDEPPQHLAEVHQQDSTNPVTATAPAVPLAYTTERAVVHEQIKLQQADKANPTNKLNSKRPVYQPVSQELSPPPAAIELHPAPYESMGLEASTAFLPDDVRRFADLCNELAFKLWTTLTSKGQISSRSLVMSPFAVTSLLAMVFLGARGATSGQMNDILRLDDMVTFNPHQVLQNVTDSVLNSKHKGVATAAFVRELYSDKAKGKILDFYKERAQQYYQGHVEEINFSTVGDIIRRRTNLLVKRQTLGRVAEYLRGSSLNMKPPLAAFSANIFQTDCELGSTESRDGEMYFVVRPSTRQRRLVPVPAVVWRQGFLAGYEPGLDATSVCLGPDSVVSTILILPGQQGQVAPGDGLARLEQRLIETSYRRGAWSRLLRSQLPRPGLELQVPRFSHRLGLKHCYPTGSQTRIVPINLDLCDHRSVLNITGALTRMGLRDLFGSKADLRGLNGLSNDLHLSDMVQVNTFSTCGEETVGARHHVETYPASPQRTGRLDSVDLQPSIAEMLHDYNMQQQWDDLPLSFRPRQARLPDNPRLRFDRPFLYVVRHNPSGIILHMGRFNPRLLP